MIGNHNLIRNEGYRILANGLGTAGAIIFLQQFENGSGNYTEQRDSWLNKDSIDVIAERIIKRNANIDKQENIQG